MRSIRIYWRDQRNIKRVYRWLDIGADLKGFLWKKGYCVGHKTATDKGLIFNFYPKTSLNKKGVI